MEEDDASLRSPQPDCTWQPSARADRRLRRHRGLSCDPVSTGARLTPGPSQGSGAIGAFRIPPAPGSDAPCRLQSQHPHDQVLLQTPPDMRKGAGVLPVGGAVRGPVIGNQEGAALTLAGYSVICARFALPRVPAPTGRTGRRSALRAVPALLRGSAIRGFAAVRLAGGGVVGAGFALPRDAGRRPALHREIGVASVVGAGFALPRDAGQRPALHREIGVARCWCGFRAPARCRSETGAPAVRLASVVGCGFRAPARCRSETGAPAVRWAWPALLVRVSRSRAMPVGDRRSWACAPPCVGGGYPSAKKTDGSELCSLPA